MRDLNLPVTSAHFPANRERGDAGTLILVPQPLVKKYLEMAGRGCFTKNHIESL